MKHTAKFLVSAAAFAIGSVAMPALAQNAPSEDNSDGSDEITVTAQRIEQRLQDVPVAVTPVTSAELERKGLNDLTQLAGVAPSLEVTTDNAFTLRGVGSQIFSSVVDSSVGVAVDEVSLGVPLFMSNAAFLDVRQVEVLTGPQGLLFGRNASAGLLNIVTNRPKLNDTSGVVNVEYDLRDRQPGGKSGLVATGVLNVPLGENAAIRLNVLSSTQDPISFFRVNTSPNAQLRQTRLMGKIKLLWEPSDKLSSYLIADYSKERGAGGIWDDTVRVAPAGSAHLRAATADGATPGPENFVRGVNGPLYRSINTYGLSLNTSYELSDSLTLSNISAWRAYDLDQSLDSDTSSLSILDINNRIEHYNQFSNELRLAFKGDKIDGQLGVYYFRSKTNSTGRFQGANASPTPNFIFGLNNFRNSGRSLAAYGQINFHATDQLQFLAGARVTNDRIAIAAVSNQYQRVLTPFPLGQFGPPALPVPVVNIFGPPGQPAYSLARSNTNFSYKIGAQYNFTDDVMAYATWGTGYKGPAYAANLVSLVAPKNDSNYPYIRPETVNSLEVGIKSQFMDRRITLNIAGFISKFKDFQTQVFDSTGQSVLGNAEGVKTTGVEINSNFKVTPQFTINYNATISDSHFTKYSTAPCYTGQSPTTCTNLTPARFFDAAGLQTPASSKYHGTLEALYEVPLGDESSVTVSANWFHRSSLNFSANAAPFQKLDPIDTFGASIAYDINKNITLQVFCRNCTNKVYPNFISQNVLDANGGLVSTTNRWGYNSVRTIGFSGNLKF